MDDLKAHHADSASAWQIMGSIVFVVFFVGLGFYYMGRNMTRELERRGIVSSETDCSKIKEHGLRVDMCGDKK